MFCVTRAVAVRLGTILALVRVLLLLLLLQQLLSLTGCAA
jgi:hypothetical protein